MIKFFLREKMRGKRQIPDKFWPFGLDSRPAQFTEVVHEEPHAGCSHAARVPFFCITEFAPCKHPLYEFRLLWEVFKAIVVKAMEFVVIGSTPGISGFPT
jgi:hypothetical protein